MSTQEAVTQLTSLVGQRMNECDALKMALDLLTTGYQSDQVAIAAATTAAQVAADQKVADFKATIASAIVSVQTSIQA